MSLKDLKIIDPRTIDSEDFFVFVSSGDLRGVVGSGIRERTHSNFNHSMIMRRPGYVCTQGLFYNEIPIENYMKSGVILKFWTCTDLTYDEKTLIDWLIQRDLNKPAYQRFYDFPGAVGQLFGIRWFNIPWLNYCSERVSSRVRVIIPDLKNRPTPEDVEQAYKNSARFRVLGYWLNL